MASLSRLKSIDHVTPSIMCKQDVSTKTKTVVCRISNKPQFSVGTVRETAACARAIDFCDIA